jgi:hypothetical protein
MFRPLPGFAQGIQPGAVRTSHTVYQSLTDKGVQGAVNGHGINRAPHLSKNLRNIHRSILAGKHFQHRQPNRGLPKPGSTQLILNRG